MTENKLEVKPDLPEIDLNEAERFLKLVDPKSKTKFVFQTFADSPKDKASEKIKKELAQQLFGTLKQRSTALIRLNQRGAGIFVTMNTMTGGRRSKENALGVRSVFADDDIPRTNGPRTDWALPPSISIESSGGKYHYYWLVDDLPLDKFTSVQKAIAVKYKTDGVVHDLPRVMRIPGFYHNKGEPFQMQIIEASGVRYTAEQILEAFPPEPESATDQKKASQSTTSSKYKEGVSKKGTPYICDLSWDTHGEFHRRLINGEDIPTSNAAVAKLPNREDSDNDSACPYSLDDNGLLIIHDFSKGTSHHFDEVSTYRAMAWNNRGKIVPKGDVSKEEIMQLTDSFFVADFGKPSQIIEACEGGELIGHKRGEFNLKFSQYQVPVFDENANRKGSLEAFPVWSKHAARRNYRKVVFKPNMDAHEDDYNMFTGFAIEPCKGDWSEFNKFLLEVICDGSRVSHEYVLNWFASLFQNPGAVGGTVLVFYSEEHGTGKTFAVDIAQEIIGKAHAHTINNSQGLFSNFNFHLMQTIFLNIDEAIIATDTKAMAEMKHMATGKELKYEMKGIDSFWGDNLLSMIMTAQKNPLGLEWYDRRYPTFKVSPCRLKDRKYFASLSELMYGHKEALNSVPMRQGAGGAAFLYDMLRRDISQWNREEIPESDERLAQKMENLPAEMQWLHEVYANGGFDCGDTTWNDNPLLRVPCVFNSRVPTAILHHAYARFYERSKKRHWDFMMPSPFGRWLRKQKGFSDGGRPYFTPELGCHDDETVSKSTTQLSDEWQQRISDSAKCAASFGVGDCIDGARRQAVAINIGDISDIALNFKDS